MIYEFYCSSENPTQAEFREKYFAEEKDFENVAHRISISPNKSDGYTIYILLEDMEGKHVNEIIESTQKLLLNSFDSGISFDSHNLLHRQPKTTLLEVLCAIKRKAIETF